jgi:hypothetical protein
MMRMCCVCHRIERNGAWEPVSSLSENEQVTHGYCPACYAEAMAEVAELTSVVAARTLTVANWDTLRGQWT